MNDSPFDKVARAFLAHADVSTGRMFGAEGLKINGKVFAMTVKGDLVVKLPAERCASLIETGSARAFDPGHGRSMKEWVAVPANHARVWQGLANEALAFVRDS